MASVRSNVFILEGNWRPLLRDLGIDARAVLRRAELPGDLFSRQSATLSTPDYFRMWTAVEQEAGHTVFPIQLVEALRSESFHPLIFAALCSSNFSVATQRIAHYKRLCAPMQLHIEEDDASLSIEFEWLDRTVEPPMSLAAFEPLFFVQLARMGTRERIQPLRVETPRPPKPATDYKRFLGVRMERSEAHRVTFSREDAYRPFLTANDSMWQLFEPDLRRRLTDLDSSATFTDRVRAALLESLPGGESSMEEIASKLAISKRTLQRRLRDEGTTFQAVLNATREDLARYYLSKTKLSGSEISYLLGFEDPNSFFRAFHTWTGQTTEQVRLSSALA
ncbi:MAG: AraC family transcriptional regulator ligand-binding domain-containing protein [Myxococcota bacterium]